MCHQGNMSNLYAFSSGKTKTLRFEKYYVIQIRDTLLLPNRMSQIGSPAIVKEREVDGNEKRKNDAAF